MLERSSLLLSLEAKNIALDLLSPIRDIIMSDFILFHDYLYLTPDMRASLCELLEKYNISYESHQSPTQNLLKVIPKTRECINDIKTLRYLIANPDRLDEISALMWANLITLFPSERQGYIATLKEAMHLIQFIEIDEYNASKVIEYVRAVNIIFKTDQRTY
jgi:hypothetical protein